MSMKQWEKDELNAEVKVLKKHISQFKKRLKECEALLLQDALSSGTNIDTLVNGVHAEATIRKLKRAGILTVEDLLCFFLPHYVPGFTTLRHIGPYHVYQLVGLLIEKSHLPNDYRSLNNLPEYTP